MVLNVYWRNRSRAYIVCFRALSTCLRGLKCKCMPDVTWQAASWWRPKDVGNCVTVFKLVGKSCPGMGVPCTAICVVGITPRLWSFIAVLRLRPWKQVLWMGIWKYRLRCLLCVRPNHLWRVSATAECLLLSEVLTSVLTSDRTSGGELYAV
jgi:hypothetical protein